jgi:mono/diheme cytochrome c family protein
MRTNEQIKSHQNKAEKMARAIFFVSATTVAILAYVGFTGGTLSPALGKSDGAELFAKNCAACHKDGKNIVNAKKPIIGSAQLKDKKTFKSYLLKPTGTMPPSPAIANNDADLTAVFDYCKSLK